MDGLFYKMADALIERFKEVSSKLKIYIYPFFPQGYTSVTHFVDSIMNSTVYDWGEIYKSWLYFTHFLVHSPMYVEDPSKADLFLVPQWENLNRSRSYRDDLIRPVLTAIMSDTYRNSGPKRNHIFIYISDDTPLSDFRIPPLIKQHFRERFIRLTYSGRIPDFGQNHRSDQPMLQYDPENEIVVPPGIPLEYDLHKEPPKVCANTFLYSGWDIKQGQKERANFLKYMEGRMSPNQDSYFGIHCAGFGIWTSRFYNYLNMGIIPVVPSDGVVLPFEKFLNYPAFSVKLLSSTYNTNNKGPIQELERVAERERSGADTGLFSMQKNAKEVANWFYWRSKEPFKNPFTLIILELYQFVSGVKGLDYSIAKKEFYNVEEGAKLPLYHKI
jgi:hypothetical protein